MAIHVKPSREQVKLMDEFRDHTCFEFIGIDRVSASDPAGFIRDWDANIVWLRDMVDETDRLLQNYRAKHNA